MLENCILKVPSDSVRIFLNEIYGHRVKLSVFVSGTSSDQVSGAKLKRLLDVESALVNEYVGDIRSRINAMAG